MAKRIVKETLANNSVQYRVEKNTMFFGLIKCKWHTDMIYVGDQLDAHFPAVFETLEEAETFAYGEPKSLNIIKREVL